MLRWLKKLINKRFDKTQNVWYNIGVKEKNKGEIEMKNLEQFLTDYKTKTFKVANDKINQVERNAFKSGLVSALAEDLKSAGLTVGKVDGGIAFLVENDQLGSISVVVDGVVKGLDYDFDFEVQDYANLQAEKAENLAKRKAKAK